MVLTGMRRAVEGWYAVYWRVVWLLHLGVVMDGDDGGIDDEGAPEVKEDAARTLDARERRVATRIAEIMVLQ